MMGISTMDADGPFGVPVMAGLDKAARLDYGESLMTHAMVFQGVNLDVEGKPALCASRIAGAKTTAMTAMTL